MKEVEIWIARDRDGSLFGHFQKPTSKKNEIWDFSGGCISLPDRMFPSVKWEDKEPTKAKITLIK